MELREAIKQRQLRPIFMPTGIPIQTIDNIISASLSGVKSPQQSGLHAVALSDPHMLGDLSNKAARWIKSQYEGEPEGDPIRSIVFSETWHPLNHAPALLIVTSDHGPCSEGSSTVAQNLTLACAQAGLDVRSLAFLLGWFNTADGKKFAGLPSKAWVEAVFATGMPLRKGEETHMSSRNLSHNDSLLETISVYHLTPSGWQRADSPPYPEERVETVLCEMDSQEDNPGTLPAFTCLWKSPKCSLSEINSLHRAFGEVPERLE